MIPEQSGYDYNLQVWVIDYICQPCAHPASMRVNNACCSQWQYQGLDVRTITGHESKWD